MRQKTFYTELSYVLGMITLAFGCAFMERADFGLSMVVAPAYLLFRRLSQIWSFVTFGMMEYIFQAFLLLLMILAVRKFKVSYLFSFVTAVIYGYTLNLTMALTALIPGDSVYLRLALYLVGMLLCSVGVACMLHTYIAAEVYELIVKVVPEHFHLDLTRFKTAYDCVSCLVGIVLSFCFFGFGHFEGVKLGTIFCAFVNGFLIGRISGWMDRNLVMKDALPLRPLFDR